MINRKTITFELSILSPEIIDPILASFARLLMRSLVSMGERVNVYSDLPKHEAGLFLEKLGLGKYVNSCIGVDEVNSTNIVIDQLAITIFYGKTLCQLKQLINSAREV